MNRRVSRLRREYLYRKSLQGAQKEEYEKKRAIREALQEGKALPTELRKEATALKRKVDLEDDNTAVQRTNVDDEYGDLGIVEPQVLVTTSRDPSSSLTAFAKEVALLIPGAKTQNRGTSILSDLVDSCRASSVTDIIVLHENRGKPDGMVVCHLPFGPTAYFGLHNCVARHDIGTKSEVGTMSEVKPNLIFDNFSTPLGQRFATILKALFPVPKPVNKRIVTFANRDDYISLRHHTYTMPAGPKSCELTEVGPRLELHPYKIRLGTLADSHAEDEWVMRAFTRSAAKRQRLADPAADADAT